MPVLLLVGGASKGGVPQAEVALMRSSLRSFQVDTVAGSGLFVQEEQPQAVLAGVGAMTMAAGGGAIPGASPGVFASPITKPEPVR